MDPEQCSNAVPDVYDSVGACLERWLLHFLVMWLCSVTVCPSALICEIR